MTLRRETIIPALAIVIIAATVPFAILGLLFNPSLGREWMRSGATDDTTLFAMGIIMDIVFQMFLYQKVHPGAALLVGPIFVCFPYALSRALTNRFARWSREK